MKYQQEQPLNSLKITQTRKNRKNTDWKSYEDEALKKQIKKFKGGDINWNLVAKKMQSFFGDQNRQFNFRACKNRYNHYLKDGLNHNELTDQEIEKLIELAQVHGNQWSIISKQMNNRTEQFVKNKFYALVKKVLRKLHQLLTQQRNSSALTNQLKPHIISKFLCGSQDDDMVTEKEKQIRMIAQELVFSNLKITKQSKLDDQDRDKLLIVLDFMTRENQKYLQENKRVSKQSMPKKEDFSCFSINQQSVQINPFSVSQNPNLAGSQNATYYYEAQSVDSNQESINQRNISQLQMSSPSNFLNIAPFHQTYSNFIPSLSYMQE